MSDNGTYQQGSRSHIAFLIDYDNAQLTAQGLGLTRCRASQLWVAPLVREIERVVKGTVEIRKCYGNTLLNAGRVFTDKIYKVQDLRDLIAVDVDHQKDLLNNGFQMIHTPDMGGKNRADILMALDCMEIVSKYEQIDTVAILSHDSDFSPLIHRLRALGKQVVLVTVGDKIKGKGKRSLEVLANYRVRYAQDLIDKSGYETLRTVLKEFSDDELMQGVVLPQVWGRMIDIQPLFSEEDTGFSKFIQFVDACIEPPLIVKKNQIKISQHTETAVQEATEQEQAIAADLRKKGLRPLPAQCRKIEKWLRENLFDESGKPKENNLSYSLLKQQLEEDFCPHESISKAQLGDVLKMMTTAEVIRMERLPDVPFQESPVLGICDPNASLRQIAALVIRRLEITLDKSDIGTLCRVVFGNTEEASLSAMREGFGLAGEQCGI